MFALARAGVIVLSLALAGCDGGFDPEIWRAERGNFEKDNRRAGMLPEVLDELLKPGMTQAEIAALLGPPDGTASAGDVYYLGRSAYGVHYETLEIAYDGGRRMVSAKQRRI